MTKREQRPSGISISKLQRPLRVRSKPLKATLAIRPLLMGDLEFLEDLAHENLSDREFVVRILHHQINTPALDIQNILNLSDRSLLHLASRWGIKELSGDEDCPVSIRSFQEFRERVNALTDEWGKNTQQLVDSIQTSLSTVSLPPFHESFLKSTQWMDSIVRYPSQLDMLTRPAIESIKLYDSMFKNLPADLERIRVAMLGTQEALTKLMDTAQIGDGFNRLIDNLTPALVSMSTIHQEQIERLNEAFCAISGAELSRMSDAIFRASQGLGNIFPLIDHDLPILTPRLLEPISTYTPNPLLIPSLPDVGELTLVRSEEQRDEGTAQGLSEDRTLVFDFQLDMYLLNLAKHVEVTFGYQVDQVIYHKTCDSGFEANVWHIFTGTITLKDRLKNIQEALEAHRRGQFTLSVPALMAQLEGVITDMLVLRGIVFRDGSKARRSDNRAELAGLKGKIDLYAQQFQNISPVTRVRQFIVDRVAPDRNYTQHGVPNDRYTVGVSTHLLVLIYYFGSQLMAWERLWQ
jgi:hypothetical protein